VALFKKSGTASGASGVFDFSPDSTGRPVAVIGRPSPSVAANLLQADTDLVERQSNGSHRLLMVRGYDAI
jgi:hypothetical protein